MGETVVSSSKGKEEKVVVDLNQLYLQVALIEQEIEALRALEAQLQGLYQRTRRARESIDALVSISQDEEVMIALDTDMNAIAAFKPVKKDEILVNIGLGVYVRMDVSDAQKILGRRENTILSRLKEVSSRLTELSRLHSQYQAILQAAAVSVSPGSR